ncbi:hypothetical protein NCS52_00976600 [Fusarium sp. LHS14.1]|nr:hypothetical protein NCS52_00976600 [Fusarium sp. LHS14.1]
MDSDPFSEVGSACIKKWLKQCSKHEACQPPKTAFVPTRLLDVGNEVADDQRRLRIVLGKALDEKVSYTALSYCWGNSPSSRLSAEIARTVQANLAARLGHVSEETLSQTIRDAITVTRWLGIRYLWVDLLCIVQDDPLDWSKESQVMENIFHHASLTIAATSAVSITQGFLRRPRCQRIKLSINSNTEKPDLVLRYPEWLMHEYIWDNDWRTRGWIFQEQKLSHRVLHFARGILYFECASGFRCEWMEMRPELSDDDNEWVLQNPFWSPQCFLGANNPTTFDTWYGDVEWFSMKTLTFPEDKLPAISGLARVTAKVVGSRYLAGLWMDDLHIGLLWKAPTSCILRRPPRSRAPSWSWAALDGGLEWQTYRSDSDMPLAKILNVDGVPDPSDPQKRLFTGFLDLNGCLMKFQDAEDHDILQNPCGNNGDYRTDSTWYVSDLGVEFTHQSSLWVLPILLEEMVRGLILEPTSKGNESNEFRRVGWYESEPQRNRVLKSLESQNTTSVRIV